MTEKPKIVAVSPREGDMWIDWEFWNGGRVHAIKFADGSIWDAVNGWRKPLCPTCHKPL